MYITQLKVVAICMRGSHIYCHLIFSLVVLSGSSDNPDFLGFLVQGKVMADDTTATGTFMDNGDDQQTVCTDDVSVTIYDHTIHVQIAMD